MSVEAIKRKLRNGDRSNVIEQHGGEWRLAQLKGGICVGITTHDTLEQARRIAEVWSHTITVKK